MTMQPSITVSLEQTTEAIKEALQDAIGPQLTALYCFETPIPSGINLLAVIKDHQNLHQIRQALQPHYQTRQLRPYLATPTALARYLQLDSLFASHLSQNSQLLLGQPVAVKQTAVSLPEKIGLLAGSAIDASSVLAPRLINEAENEAALQSVALLADYLGLDTRGKSAIQTLAAIQGQLARMIAPQPDLKWPIPSPNGAPPMVDALVAIYERQDRAIFILPDWPPEEIEAYINRVDWTAVSASLEGQYNGLQLTTPSQFRLMLEYDKTADFYFDNYVHAWGINALASLEMPRWRIFRDLACFASAFEIKDFTQAYLSAPDDKLNLLIHDYQNKLLNIQLREELLHRMTGRDRALPPPLPGREVPTTEKVAAIFGQFAWWADLYTERLNAELSKS